MFCSFVGELGTSGERELVNSANNFERGQVDQFTIQSEDIGRITAAEVSADRTIGSLSCWPRALISSIAAIRFHRLVLF